MTRKDLRSLIVFGISFLPVLYYFTVDYRNIQINIIKFFTSFAYIAFFWLVFTGFREGVGRQMFSTNFLNIFHKTLGPIAFVIMFIHPLGYVLLYENPSLLVPFATRFSLLMQLGIIAFWVVIVTVAATYLVRKQIYQRWKVIHHLNYLFFGLTFTHSLVVASRSGIRIIDLYYILLFLITVLTALQKLTYDLKLFASRVKVREAKLVGTDTYNLVLETVSEQIKSWQVGQYALVAWSRSHDNHPFSISRKNADGSLELTFKVLGDFTAKLKEIKAGDTLFLTGAFGELGNDLGSIDGPLVFLAGGIGVTPFRSMIYQLLESKDPRQVYLYYGAKDPAMLAFHDEFSQLAASSQNFFYQPVIEQGELEHAAKGFITIDMLKQANPTLAGTFFVCGPPVMMKILKKALAKAQVPLSRVRAEDFGY